MLSFEENHEEHCWNVIEDCKHIAFIYVVNGLTTVVPCDARIAANPLHRSYIDNEFIKFREGKGD